MNLKDLWIGDKVYVKIFQANGIWEGFVSKEKAKIKYKNKIHIVDIIELDEAKEEVEELQEIKIDLSTRPLIDPLNFKNVIDLHIDKLNPTIEYQLPELILNFQINACKSYIEKAISIRKLNLTIIHGKGKGVLKQEVIHILKSIPNYKYHIEKNEGGAVEVFFNYV